MLEDNMSIIKIDSIYLYTSIFHDADESPENYNQTLTDQHQNSKTALGWMQFQELNFINLNYGDVSQHPAALQPLNSWFDNTIDINSFPFVIYDEVNDNFRRTKRILYGIDDIITSNLVALSKLDPKVT
jgi:hypothetical protein